MDIFEQIRAIGALPVAVINSAENAVELAKALERGGLPAVEVTLRTDAALDAIARIREACPDLLVGAGTVLTPDQTVAAAEAGARFLVSPGLNPEVVKTAQGLGLPMIPGAITPTEVEAALALGLTTLKFFPAEAAGGAAFISALSAPYPMVRWMPTGGVDAANTASYLKLKTVVAVGLSKVCEKSLIDAGDFAEIERRASEIAALIRDLRG